MTISSSYKTILAHSTPSAKIRYRLPEKSLVELKILNTFGEEAAKERGKSIPNLPALSLNSGWQDL